MDYKQQHNDLLLANRQLKKELALLQSENQGKNEVESDMIFRVFNSASYLMAISKLDTGQYVDVNDAFLKALGYKTEEIIGRTSDDLQIFADLEDSNKYFKLIAKLKKIKDYAVTLRTKSGEEKPYLFSAETVKLENELYLLTIYNEIDISKNKMISESHGVVLDEIFETVSSYLALFSIGEDNRIYIIDLNRKVEDVEFIKKSEVIGKCIDDTPLTYRRKLIELLHHLRITGEPHKLSTSVKGDDSEGYYMGFILTSGNFVVTWEPGNLQKRLDKIHKQSLVFEKFAELLPEMVFELDLSGKILYSNQRCLDFYGYSKADIKKGISLEVFFPDNSKEMIRNLKALKSPGEISNSEYYVNKKDGSFVPVVTHSFGTFIDDRIIGYRGTITDISTQKNYENQINREKAFLEQMYNSTPAAIVITDYDGIISMVNREFTNLFGYSPEEAIDKNIYDLIVPDDVRKEAIRNNIIVSMNHKEEVQTIRKDKTGKRIHVTLVATGVEINNEIGAYLSIYSDITIERKNQLLQEILFNISTAALKQSEIKEIYPTIVQELSKIWDTNNFFIALYDEATETLSLPFFADERDSFKEIPADKTITRWVIRENKSVLLKENDMLALEANGSIDLIGAPCKVWMGVPLKAESKTIGVMCLQDYHDENKFSNEDLSVLDFIANQIAIALQRRIMLDNLITARQKAEDAAQTKQLFMSTMSHEIRTPLNEVIGITNLLLQSNPREDQMDYINTLKFSGNHLLTLVNDVLDYNKMDSGKIIFEETQFNLSEFLEEIMRSYSFRSKAKRLDFDIKKGNNLPTEVIGDPIRLNQILSNLLSNALKFTSKGSITLTVNELQRTGKQSKIEFIVYDTGIGIPKDKQSEIFESFTQASPDTTRHFGGTGLGLAICKKLVEQMGGSITIESELGKGSTFSFAMSFGISEKVAGTVQTASLPDSYAGLEGKKILVAEDNKINFFVANKFLVGWGVKVTHAENGQLALDCLEKDDFDLVLMDLHMPVMDGIEATRIIRKSEKKRIREIPVIALTAAIMSENNDKIEDLNISDYVLKPFRPHDLFERILKFVK